jgi:hypothetical protein
MRVRPLLVSATIALCVLDASAAARGFSWDSTALYQPDENLRARGVDGERLAGYMKQLERVCTSYFASEAKPERLDIVVGLKPGQKSRVWFVSSRRSSQDPSLAALKKKLELVPTYSVKNGPVAFALRCSIAGGGPAPKTKGVNLPMPKEWHDAAVNEKRSLSVPDGMFERIWRD